jgi:hypothetical protein
MGLPLPYNLPIEKRKRTQIAMAYIGNSFIWQFIRFPQFLPSNTQFFPISRATKNRSRCIALQSGPIFSTGIFPIVRTPRNQWLKIPLRATKGKKNDRSGNNSPTLPLSAHSLKTCPSLTATQDLLSGGKVFNSWWWCAPAEGRLV